MATVNCLRCGVSNRSGSNYCNNCGAELPGATDAPAPGEAGASDRDLTAAEAEESPRPEHSSTPSGDPPFQQPWLRSDEEEADDIANRAADDEADQWSQTERLITGVQGLLEPNAIATPLPDSDEDETPERTPATSTSTSPIDAIDDIELRQLRRWLSTVPVQSQHADQGRSPGRQGGLFLPALFLLLGLGIALPVLLQPARPSGNAHVWPGVRESFALITALPDNARVLTYWAYDPATAGEMDFVAHPVLTHLIGKRSQLIVASPLPGGPPTLLNLAAQIAAETRLSYLDPLPVMIGYLPGGATVLPLLGQGLDQLLPPPATTVGSTPLDTIDLALVVTARAEDAQAWLEQVQPRTRAPVLVVSSAGADPVLRPYWHSGQIAGLVSGFDGGSAYWSLLSNSASNAGEDVIVPAAPLLRVRRWMVFQNWGHLIFILIIVLGNIAGFVQRRRGDGTMPAASGMGYGYGAAPGPDSDAGAAHRG